MSDPGIGREIVAVTSEAGYLVKVGSWWYNDGGDANQVDAIISQGNKKYAVIFKDELMDYHSLETFDGKRWIPGEGKLKKGRGDEFLLSQIKLQSKLSKDLKFKVRILVMGMNENLAGDQIEALRQAVLNVLKEMDERIWI